MVRRSFANLTYAVAAMLMLLPPFAAANTDAIWARYLKFCATKFPNDWTVRLDECKRAFVQQHEGTCAKSAPEIVEARAASFAACSTWRAVQCVKAEVQSKSWDNCVLGNEPKPAKDCAASAARHVAAIDCQIAKDLGKTPGP